MRIGIHAVRLLVVGGEVFDTRAYVVLLHTGDVGGSGLAGHYGILGIILEVTAAERVTHDVQGRRQQNVGTVLLDFFTDGLAHLFHQLCVPGRGEQRTDGEVCAIVRGLVALTLGVDAQSGRTVSQYHGRNAERVERIGGAGSTRYQVFRGTYHGFVAGESGHTNTNHKVGLVLKRHLSHDFFLINRVLSYFVGRVTAHKKGSHAEGEKHYFHRHCFHLIIVLV